jgi:hypothetical protein
MSQRNASLSHHFHEISKAELEPKIPPDAKDDDLPVEMAALEKVIHVRHPGSRPQKQVCGEYARFLRLHQSHLNRSLLRGPATDEKSRSPAGNFFPCNASNYSQREQS